MVVAILLCGLAVPLAAVEKTGAEPESTKEVKELQKQVAKLNAKVKELEGRLEKSEKATQQRVLPKLPELRQFGIVINPPPFHVPFPNFPLSRSGQPKTWGGGKINGWPYYYIPCQDK